ncbi:MAG: hypothetical protein IJZ09_05480 [Tidjanibacter sp.]|nr:hypothetical protein [Tidjanibacter sp.]
MPKCWLITFVALVAVSCSERPVGAAVADTPRAEWCDAVEVCYDSDDTLSLHNLAVVARCEAAHAKELLPLRVEVQSPSGANYAGEVVLTPSARHTGGSFVEFSADWIEDACFGEVGDYRFLLTPCQPTDGVWNVGVRVDRIEN